MIIKLFKWCLLAIVLVVLCLVLILLVGSGRALDRELRHTSETSALPLYSADISTGQVRIVANGYEFRARIAGCENSEDGSSRPAVILLHGFPVSSAMWLTLISPLAEAGYCVVAPDQRGYSPGARPEAVDDYSVDKLVADVVAVADALQLERFHLVGHDWGAVVGWATVMEHPQRISSWTALSIPHPAAFGRALESDPDQQSRSSYFVLFTTPWLPEALFSFNDFALLKGAYTGMMAEQVSEYVDIFSEPGAMTAALNWYRAMAASRASTQEIATDISTPTLFIWGNRDEAVGRKGVELQREYIIGPYNEIELGAGHWLLVAEPAEVISRVIDHLGRNL